LSSWCAKRHRNAYRDRILSQKDSRVGDVKLRGFQRAYVHFVRLIEQNGEFTEHGARLRHLGNLPVLLEDRDGTFLEDQQPSGPRTIDDYALAGLIGHDWKGGDTVLSGGLFGMNRRCAMDWILIGLTASFPLRIDHPEWRQEFS